MPFPWKKPTTIHCLPEDLLRIHCNENGLVWLNIIAVKGTDVYEELSVDFYALTRINNKKVPPNITLPNEGPTCELVIPLFGSPNRKHFHFIQIPTTGPIISFENELTKYCSPLLYTDWTLLDGFEHSQIFVLRPTILPLVSDRQLLPVQPPSITFNFPILDTLENRVDIEELAQERHMCQFAPCSEFIICPSTFFEPEIGTPSHKHCIDKNCVRFFEKTDIALADN